jgi:trans-2,3-dihydro-3-hydroxyanthranilate isomerase
MSDPGPGLLEFEVVDVFTDTAFTGNPLAVVYGAEELATDQMQTLAREFHLSETAFPMRPDPDEAARGVDYRLRIFTPAVELPFAGHPSVGTAWTLARRGWLRPGTVVQACGAGDLPLTVGADGGPVTLTGGAPTLGPHGDGTGLDSEALAAAVGLGPSDLVGLPCGLAGTGNEFAYLYVRPDALPRARPASLAAFGVSALYLVGWPAAGSPAGEPVRARQFAPDLGVTEDPATGSAALGLGVHAVASALLPGEGTSSFTVSQGTELGRPSTLRVEVEAAGGRAVATRVSGDVVAVSTGVVAIPVA